MNINVVKDADKVTFAIEGRIDTTSAPILEKEVTPVTEETNNIIFDFSNVEYITSAGLRVLLMVTKKMAAPKSFVVKNCNSAIMDVFEMTGFQDILTIE